MLSFTFFNSVHPRSIPPPPPLPATKLNKNIEKKKNWNLMHLRLHINTFALIGMHIFNALFITSVWYQNATINRYIEETSTAEVTTKAFYYKACLLCSVYCDTNPCLPTKALAFVSNLTSEAFVCLILKRLKLHRPERSLRLAPAVVTLETFHYCSCPFIWPNQLFWRWSVRTKFAAVLLWCVCVGNLEFTSLPVQATC